MKPIIGIVGKSEISLRAEKNTMCTMDKYRQAILQYGGIPIVILPTQIVDYEAYSGDEIGHLTNQEEEDLNRQISFCDGLIIQGGLRSYDYQRYICDYANKNNIPLLATCMGMQIMCNYNNTNENILNENKIHKSPEEDNVHLVTLNKNSKLYSIIKKETFMVNSNHTYHVENSGSYQIAGLSFDNLIEAVEKEGTFNIGVQWHPEKNYELEESKALFEAFIEAAKNDLKSF